MTEIEKVKQEIKVLEKKLALLEEMEKYNEGPAKEAFKETYGIYPTFPSDVRFGYFKAGYEEGQKLKEFQPTPQTPEQVAEGLRDAMRQAKEDGVFDEPTKENADSYITDEVVNRLVKQYQYQKLYNRVRDQLGYSIDCCDEIVDLVEDWLPKEQSAEGSQNVNTELLVDGFNDCVRKMKEMLR